IYRVIGGADLGRASRPTRAMRSVLSVSQGVIPASGLDFIALLGADFDLAEGAVLCGVGGRVAEVVLAAEFLGNLVEAFLELFDFFPDLDDAAAGSVGELLHF